MKPLRNRITVNEPACFCVSKAFKDGKTLSFVHDAMCQQALTFVRKAGGNGHGLIKQLVHQRDFKGFCRLRPQKLVFGGALMAQDKIENYVIDTRKEFGRAQMSEMERITQLLRRVMQRKGPMKEWKEFVASLPEQDDEDGMLPLQSVTRDIIGAHFFIHYVDAKDEASERRIMVRNIGYFGDELALGAYCYEREAARNFLARRIQQMADLQTGELIEKPFEWLSELSSQNPTAEALERSAPGIQILSCLAWCDGHLNEEEREVMLRYVDANASSLDLRWDVIGQFVKAMVPSLDAYDRAVVRLKFQGSDETRRIISAAKQLVLADGELTLEEAELMGRLMAYA